MNDGYILTARLFLVVATILALAGIGGLVWLLLDCWKAQRQADANDRHLERTSAALRTRACFTTRCSLNPTFPKT